MRSKKELISLNMKDLTQEEIESLADMELNICDKCGEIDSTYHLNWLDGEEFWENEAALKLMREDVIASCDECLDKAREEIVSQRN